MDNNLYQLEFDDGTTGYIVLVNNSFYGIIYTDEKNKYRYIYGTYLVGQNMELFIDCDSSLTYTFYMPTISREGIPYEKLEGPNILSVVHFDTAKGYESMRVLDITKFVTETFRNHLELEQTFLLKFNNYFDDNKKSNPILAKTIPSDEELPF